jgi:hypothetical protein
MRQDLLALKGYTMGSLMAQARFLFRCDDSLASLQLLHVSDAVFRHTIAPFITITSAL